MSRARYPHATGACHADRCAQGRMACPCPQACELPEPWVPPAQRLAMSLLAHAVFTALCAAGVVCLIVFRPGA